MLLDLRYSIRSFARTPGLTIALLLTIALGVGGNAAITGYVRGLARRNVPLAGEERVVSVFARDARGEFGAVTWPEYLQLKAQTGVFEWLGAVRIARGTVDGTGIESVQSVAAVTPELARALDLSKSPAEGLYAGQVIDRWIPLAAGDETHFDPDARNVWVIGRLRPNANPGQAGGFLVTPYLGLLPQTTAAYNRSAGALWIIAGAVLFIASANTASFLLGRAAARTQEVALRIALGAGQGALARQLLADSVVLALGGGVLGLLLAQWTARIVPLLLYSGDAGQAIFAPDLSSVAGAAALCICITIVCGLAPLAAISNARPSGVLRRENAGPSPRVQRLRTAIAIAQLACCCALATSTAFLLAGLRGSVQTGAGRGLGDSVLAAVQADPNVGLAYFQRVERVAREMGAVTQTAWMSVPPGGQPVLQSFRVEPAGLPVREVRLDARVFAPSMAEQFHLPPAAGRMFGAVDQTCRVAIVNTEAAEILYRRETPGRVLIDPTGAPVEILGVVKRRGPGRSGPAIFYSPNAGAPSVAAIRPFRVPANTALKRAELAVNVVSPAFFDLGLAAMDHGSLMPGRDRRNSCRTAAVNQEAATLYFGGHAIGAAVIDENGRRTEISGVVRSIPIGGFQARQEPEIYFPMVQDWLPRMTILMRTETPDLLPEVRRRLEAVDGRGPAPIIIKTVETHLRDTSLAPLRIVSAIAAAATGIALLLGLLGVGGTLSDAAQRRGRELAIRIALGAKRRHIMGRVFLDGARLGAGASIAGLVVSLVFARLLRPAAPPGYAPALWVWLAGPALLALAVTAAAVLPARRAALANPLVLLRN